jgi:hypothetical protein
MDRRLGPAAWIAMGLQALLFLATLRVALASVGEISGLAGFPSISAVILAVLVAGAVRAARGVCGSGADRTCRQQATARAELVLDSTSPSA